MSVERGIKRGRFLIIWWCEKGVVLWPSIVVECQYNASIHTCQVNNGQSHVCQKGSVLMKVCEGDGVGRL